MMRFKLFGTIWNITPVIGLFWCFIGFMICGLGFMVDVLGWWNIPYLIVALLYGYTAESVLDFLKKHM